jgi:hypothetical protein
VASRSRSRGMAGDHRSVVTHETEDDKPMAYSVSNRSNLSRPHSKLADSGTLIDPSLEFSSAHRYVNSHFGVVALLNYFFAHAQVISELLPAAHEPLIEVVSRIPESLLPDSAPDGGATQSVVALRQGRHLLTTFHPELTDDSRFHEYFVQKCVLPSLAP